MKITMATYTLHPRPHSFCGKVQFELDQACLEPKHNMTHYVFIHVHTCMCTKD